MKINKYIKRTDTTVAMLKMERNEICQHHTFCKLFIVAKLVKWLFLAGCYPKLMQMAAMVYLLVKCAV